MSYTRSVEVVNFILCEHINYSREWQYNILGGGITSLSFQKFPTEFAMYALIQLMLEPSETNIQHTLKLQTMGEDKMIAEKIFTPFQVSKGTVYYTVDTLLRIPCERPGWFRFDVFVDNVMKREWRLHISLNPFKPVE